MKERKKLSGDEGTDFIEKFFQKLKKERVEQ